MKRKSIAAVSIAVLVMVTMLVSSAGAGGRFALLRADLTLRPGVSRSAHHRVPEGEYGSFDGTFNRIRSTVGYSIDYEGLNGSVFRVAIRSQATGKTLAVLCNGCHSVSAGRGRSGLQISQLGGVVHVDPDVGFLIAHDRTFVELDSTAYPSGEIGGPLSRKVFHGYTETPRCC
jgi:hypothetical protein